MARKRITRREILKAADAIGPEDGVDPRLEKRGGSDPRPNRKALQLADQVMQTLSGVLVGECDDDVLRDLLVESVVPAPTGSRLLVTLTLAPSAPAHSLELIQTRLGTHAALIRSEVAAAIHRRKMPDLVYQVRLTPRPAS